MAAVATSRARVQLRRALEAHLTALGYTLTTTRPGTPVPEIARLNPLRSSVVYAETVLRSDLDRPACHERLLFFSQRRTRRRSSIPFFVGVAEADHDALETLLQKLDIHGFGRGSQVQIVPLAIEPPARAKPAKRSRSR